MKDKLSILSAVIKNKFGLCCSKGCFHRAEVDVNLPQINVKRCLCEKHFLEFQKLEISSQIDRR